MAEFVSIGKVGLIPEGQGNTFNIGGRLVAVFNDGGDYFAIDDLCPHMGASLGAGHFERGVVTCPWHAWRFNARDGTWCDNPTLKIGCFAVRVHDGEIQVRVPEEDRGAPR